MNPRTENCPELQLSLEFNNLHPRLSYSDLKLRSFFESICSLYSGCPAGVLSIVFMERERHNRLHGQFLNDFRPTDVITFPTDPDEGLAGEICVSVDQAQEESITRKIPFCHELALYLIHGWLHLVGFDDLEKFERQLMRNEEQRCLHLIRKSNLWPDFNLAPSVP